MLFVDGKRVFSACAQGIYVNTQSFCSEKRRLIIPANMGYGMRGAGGVIPGGTIVVLLLLCRRYSGI